MKVFKVIWIVSLAVTAGILVFSLVCRFAGVALSDTAVRVLGVALMFGVLLMSFSGSKLRQFRKK
ncbi:MAG: hypothetical protein IJL66_05640 [Lachnospiraceae bacterium]|nr:hypothetical protein [Lachnospiraceae bacterium]